MQHGDRVRDGNINFGGFFEPVIYSGNTRMGKARQGVNRRKRIRSHE